jgi:thiamine-phosphate pyrophosphorylase
MASRYHPVHAPALPRLWLMTDERLGDGLMDAIRALPPGSGIIFRHYSLPMPDRRALFARIRRLTRAGGHSLLWAGSPQEARAMQADGAHGRAHGAVSVPVHSVRERIRAERAGAQLLFVSPVFPTRSHPGARALGRVKFGQMTRGARVPVIALGGMTRNRAKGLSVFGIYGWAAIDGLSAQKRKAVPT